MKIFKKIFYRLLIFAIILFVGDSMFGWLFKPIFNRQQRGKYFTTSYAIKGSSEDVVIFGNSHAAQHFDANRMKDSLGSTTFNFGNQYQSILYYYPLLESLLLHHSPKLVILNLDPDELMYNKEDYEKLSIMLPYANENSYIDSAISNLDKLEKYKAISNCYRFNSTIGYVLLNLLSKSYGKSIESRGFDPQDGSLCKLNMNDIFIGEDKKDRSRLDPVKVHYLQKMIDDLKSKNIKLFITLAPVYKGIPKNSVVFNKLMSIISENHISYVDYYNDNRFANDCSLFNDQNHLNITGADMFTDLIVREIKDRKMLNDKVDINKFAQNRK